MKASHSGYRQGQCSEGSPCAKTITHARVESGSACRQEHRQQYPAALAVRTGPCLAQNTGHRLKTRRVPVVSTAQALLPVFPGTACLRLPALLPCPVGVKPQRVFGSRLADPCGELVHGPGQDGGPISAPGIKGHQDDLSRGAELPQERCLGGLGRGGRIPLTGNLLPILTPSVPLALIQIPCPHPPPHPTRTKPWGRTSDYPFEKKGQIILLPQSRINLPSPKSHSERL